MSAYMLPLQGRRPLRQSMPSEAPEPLRLFHQELLVKQTVVLIMTIHGITFSIKPRSSLGRDLGTEDTTKGKDTHWAEPDLLPWPKSYCTVTVFFLWHSSGWKLSRKGILYHVFLECLSLRWCWCQLTIWWEDIPKMGFTTACIVQVYWHIHW